MKTIAPTFANELRAAGLFGLPFSWQEDGTINFGEEMTQEQIDAVNVVYAAHDPGKQLGIDPLTKIRALEAAQADRQAKATRIATLKSALDWACTLPQAAGKTREEVHAMYYSADTTYRELYELEQACEALRKLIP